MVPHVLSTVRGALGTGGEMWSCSLRFEKSGLPGPGIGDGPNTTACNDLLSDWRDFLDSLQNHTVVRADEVRMYNIDASGHATGDIAYSDMQPEAPASGGFKFPPQTSLVVTLDTDGRDKPRFGRFFLPWQSVNGSYLLYGDGRLAKPNIDEITSKAKTFLNNCNNWPGIDDVGFNGSLIVASRVRNETKNVTGVRVGRVLDTMRSRRSQLGEDYSYLPL